MRQALMDYYLEKLLATLGPPRAPVDMVQMYGYYDLKEYSTMVRLVKTQLDLELGFAVELIENGSRNAAISYNLGGIPPIDSPAFKSSKVTIFLQKEFLREAPFEMLCKVLAHGLTRLYLMITHNELAHDPAASDVAAILFGFGEFYLVEKAYQLVSLEDDVITVLKLQSSDEFTIKEAQYVIERLRKPLSPS
jgi:hypothetical protein